MPHPSLGLVKRLIDLALSLTALVLLLPLLLIIAIAIKVTSPGPLFYRRRVSGLHHRPFELLKFRSMVNDAHGLLEKDAALAAEYKANLKIRNDPRITPLGRWLRCTSADELPQLLNVIAG